MELCMKLVIFCICIKLFVRRFKFLFVVRGEKDNLNRVGDLRRKCIYWEVK